MSRRPRREPRGLAPHLDGMQVRVNNVPRKPAPTASAPIVPVLAEMLNYGRRLPEPNDGGGGGGTNDEAAAKAAEREKALQDRIGKQQKNLYRKQKRIDTLQEQLKVLNEQKLELTRSAREHDERHAILKRELSETEERLEAKEVELKASEAMQAEAVGVQDEMVAMEAEVERLKEQAQEATEAAAQAQARLEEEDARVQDLEQELEALRAELGAQASAHDSALAAKEDEIEGERLRNEALEFLKIQAEESAKKTEKNLSKAQGQVEGLERKNRELEEAKESSARESATLQLSNSRQRTRMQRLEKELDETRELAKQQAERLAAAQAELGAVRAAQQQALRNMKARTEATEAAAESARKESMRYSAELGQTSAEYSLRIGNLQRDCNEWNEKYHQQARLRVAKERECKEAEQQRQMAWSQVREVQAQLDAKTKEHARLTYELATVRRSELKAEEQRTRAIGSRNDQKEQELDRLREMLQNSERKIQWAEENNRALQELQKRQAQNFEARIIRSEEEKDGLRQELARLQQAHTYAPAPDSDTDSGADDVDMPDKIWMPWMICRCRRVTLNPACRRVTLH